MDERWRRLLESRRLDLLPLIEVAAEEPRLRCLYVGASANLLFFSRWRGAPTSGDLPYAQAHFGGFDAYVDAWRDTGDRARAAAAAREAAMFDVYDGANRFVGAGHADRAVELLVAALPDRVELTQPPPTD